MNKCLLSLMLLVSGWVWGAEVLPHGGVVETKAEMVELTRGKDSFMVLPDRLAPFELLATMLEDEPGDKKIELPEGIVTGVAFDFLKIYLDDSKVALADLSSYNGSQIVDIMIMLDYLNTDLDNPEIQKLNSVLINQLKDKLSPEVLQKLYQKLWKIPGIGFSQTIPGWHASWNTDGTRLWVWDRDNKQTQVYQVINERLELLGEPVPGYGAGWSPDGSKLWIKYSKVGVGHKVKVYKVVADKLEELAVIDIGHCAGFSPDGSKLWVNFLDHPVDKIQVYKVDDDGLVAVGAGAPVLGYGAGWSPDGSKLWVQFKINRTDFVRLYQIVGNALVAVGEQVRGYGAGWSPDGSKLWVRTKNSRGDFLQIYQIIAGQLGRFGSIIPGNKVKYNPDGSKLWIINSGQTQVYRVINGRLGVLGVPVLGYGEYWSACGNKLLVSVRNHSALGGRMVYQVYQVINDSLIAVDGSIPGDNAGLSPNGSKLWVHSKNDGIDRIKIYQIINDRLTIEDQITPGNNVGWCSDGSRLFVSSYEPNQTTIYFDMAFIRLSQLLKQLTPNSALYQNLSLAQQMFLIYILQEHQKINTAYVLPVELDVVWNSLSMELQGYLVSRRIVNRARSVVRPYVEIATDHDDEPDVAHRDKSRRR